MSIVTNIFITIAVIVITAFVFGLPVSFLWNATVTKIFLLPSIDWVDGAVLYILSRILFAANFFSEPA